jgi:hypothetical protein
MPTPSECLVIVHGHQIDVLVNIRPDIPLATIVFTCGSWLKIMLGGIVSWQSIPSPKLKIEPIGDLMFHGPSKALESPIIHTPWTPLTPLQSILGEISKVNYVIFNIVGENDYLQSQILAKFKHICEKMEVVKFWLEHVPPF